MARTGRKRKFTSMSSSNGTTPQLEKQEKPEVRPSKRKNKLGNNTY